MSALYDPDAILQRMRDDEESDWPHRLLDALSRTTGRFGSSPRSPVGPYRVPIRDTGRRIVSDDGLRSERRSELLDALALGAPLLVGQVMVILLGLAYVKGWL